MYSRVSFSAKRGAEDDEIFSNAGMNDVHGPHGSACIVEDPFILVGVESNFLRGICQSEVGNDVVDHSGGIVG